MEILNKYKPATFRCAILDFDGTVSLIREGWQHVMIPYFVDVLRDTPQGKDADPHQLERETRDFVDFLTGKQTIYQCLQLAEEVQKRGGVAEEPIQYKHEYHRRLELRIAGRIAALEKGCDPEEHLVPGSCELLEMLRWRGVAIYLASGTDEKYVKQEAALLKLTDYFDGGIYGAQDDYKTFSKAMVIQKIIADNALAGAELVGFGDGYVEIENVKSVGGYAVGVASDETNRGGIDPWKRDRLIKAGADVIIPDYRNVAEIEGFLFQ